MPWRLATGIVGIFFFGVIPLFAQTETNTDLPGPGEISLATTNFPSTNAAPVLSPAATAPGSIPPTTTPSVVEESAAVGSSEPIPASVLGALVTLASMGGFLLYQCGLSRARNCGHTSALLLVGVLFGLTGFWIGGFAVQTGGVGDAHAALAQPLAAAEKSALDHELGLKIYGHHWGIMGSSGFFLATDDSSRNGIADLFLIQAAWLAIAVAAALGAALERGRILAMAFCAYLIGVLIYPLLANWVWGGGWLAEMGREFGLGHGFVDLGGSGVVHETAGTLALVIAVVLGPRHGRFGRATPSAAFPGHNVPFIIFGSIVLLISWMTTNAFACAGLNADPALADFSSCAGLAAINTFLAATGGLGASFVQAAWLKQPPLPARLCRGLLGGAVASCGGAALVDPWAAFLIGAVAGVLVQATMGYLERERIDDPVGAAAVHGIGGAWGVVAVGLFANGTEGSGLNGVTPSVRGLFFGGAWHQLAAQVVGCFIIFIVVYLLGYGCFGLVQKILGNRVSLADEASGLDWPELGALGYQGDGEVDVQADSGKVSPEK